MRTAKWLASAVVLLLCAIAAAYFYASQRVETWPTFSESDAANWRAFGGDWVLANGIYTDRAGGRGDKLIAGPKDTGDYTISADMRFDMAPSNMPFGDAGLLLRVLEPQVGVDAHKGYYAALRPDDHALLIGSMDFSFRELATTPFPHDIRSGSWYHLTFMSHECAFRLQVEDPETKASAEVSYVEHSCAPDRGQVGLRSYYAKASWRNLQVSAAPTKQ